MMASISMKDTTLEMLSIFAVMDAYGPNGSFGHNSCNGHFGTMVLLTYHVEMAKNSQMA